MNSFEKAFINTMGHEGKYSFDPIDPGGETYMGISRVYWPDWLGWRYIDAGETSRGLEESVKQFYKQNFWNRFHGDALADISENIAIEVFDTAVNLGVHRAVEFLQDSLNILNVNQGIYPDMIVDGLLGSRTLEHLKRFLEWRPIPFKQKEDLLLKVMNHFQGCYYIKKMKQHPGKEKYRGWFLRT